MGMKIVYARFVLGADGALKYWMVHVTVMVMAW